VKDYYNQLEAYKRNRLSRGEKIDFERAMKDDLVLKDAAENYWKIEPVLDLIIEDDLRQEMQRIARKKEPKIHRSTAILKIAAAIALIVTALLWIFTWNNKKSGPELFAIYYQAYDLTSRSGDTLPLSTSQLALKEAHSFIQSERPLEAEDLLKSLVTQNTAEKEEAQWLLVLTALQRDDKKLAKSRLAIILEDPSNSYNDNKRQALDREL